MSIDRILMRRINKPSIAGEMVFKVCAASLTDSKATAALISEWKAVELAYIDYEIKANTFDLPLLPASAWGHDDQLVIGNVNKGALTGLYTNCFSSAGSAGRGFYDALKILAPLGKCPYCGFGQVTTLDHYLAKSRYPTFSIFPYNLVPACSDCNKGKGSAALTSASQGLHPYFESSSVETDAWLFGRVCQSLPVSIEYRLEFPAGWAQDLSARLKNHFKDLSLASRFAVEAATELATLVDVLDEMGHVDDRQAHLHSVAKRERKKRPNTWKAALYDSLKDDIWYISTGYKLAAI